VELPVEECTIPLKSFPWIVSALAEEPPVFEIPVNADEFVPLNTISPPELLPSRLLLILIALPVADPALIIPINAPAETTENPWSVLLLIETVVVAVPPLLIIPVIFPVEALVKVSAPPFESPNWLLFIFIWEAAAPVLEIPRNAPLPAVFVWLLIIFEFILIMPALAVFAMQVEFPVPLFIPSLMAFEFILSVPVLPEFVIPLKAEAPEL
jgi:hypothetical protein